MARPKKKGLSYFPLDTNLMGNRKIQRLYQSYGLQGVFIYLILLSEIYRTHGYYIPYSKELCFDIGFTLQLKEELIDEVIFFCVELRLFDQDILLTKKILTSEGIQTRYLEVKRRYPVHIHPDLIPGKNNGVIVTKTPVMVTETQVMVTETPVLDTKTPTKEKGSKSKEKQSKEKQIDSNEFESNKSKTNKISTNESESKKSDTDAMRLDEIFSMFTNQGTGRRDV